MIGAVIMAAAVLVGGIFGAWIGWTNGRFLGFEEGFKAGRRTIEQSKEGK